MKKLLALAVAILAIGAILIATQVDANPVLNNNEAGAIAFAEEWLPEIIENINMFSETKFDEGNFSLGNAYRIHHFRSFGRDERGISNFGDMISESDEWLVIINYSDISYTHVVVRNANGRFVLVYFMHGSIDDKGVFDEYMRIYQENGTLDELKVVYLRSGVYLLVNSRYEIIEASPRRSYDSGYADISRASADDLLMDGDTVMSIIYDDIVSTYEIKRMLEDGTLSPDEVPFGSGGSLRDRYLSLQE